MGAGQSMVQVTISLIYLAPALFSNRPCHSQNCSFYNCSQVRAMSTSVLCHYSFEEHEERGCFSLTHTDNTFPQLPYQLHLLNHSCVDMHNGQTTWCNSKTVGVEDLLFVTWEFGGLIAAQIKLGPGDWMPALSGWSTLDANAWDTSFQFLSLQRKPFKVCNTVHGENQTTTNGEKQDIHFKGS